MPGILPCFQKTKSDVSVSLTRFCTLAQQLATSRHAQRMRPTLLQVVPFFEIERCAFFFVWFFPIGLFQSILEFFLLLLLVERHEGLFLYVLIMARSDQVRKAGSSSAKMLQSWPMQCDLRLCEDAWRQASVAERRELTSVQEDDVVLYFKIASAQLTNKTLNAYECKGERIAALHAARLGSDFLEVCWKMTSPLSAFMSDVFCENVDSFRTIRARVAETFDDFLCALGTSKSGCPSALDGTRCSTWQSLSTDFFTLMFFQMTLKCRRRRDGDMLLLQRAVLTQESSSVRLWPSKKAAQDLRTKWSSLSPEGRRSACSLSGPPVWLVRSTKMFVGSSMTNVCLRSGIMGARSLPSSEYDKLRLDALEGLDLLGSEEMYLSHSFVATAGSLEHMIFLSVRTPAERDELLSIASMACAVLPSVAQTELNDPPDVSWKNMARVAFTLFLNAFVHFCDLQKDRERLEALAKEIEEAKAAEKRAARKASRQKKKTAAVKAAATDRRVLTTKTKPLPELRWERLSYRIVQTFIDVEVDREECEVQLRRCSSACF